MYTFEISFRFDLYDSRPATQKMVRYQKRDGLEFQKFFKVHLMENSGDHRYHRNFLFCHWRACDGSVYWFRRGNHQNSTLLPSRTCLGKRH